jgi:hypothetical protein
MERICITVRARGIRPPLRANRTAQFIAVCRRVKLDT